MHKVLSQRRRCKGMTSFETSNGRLELYPRVIDERIGCSRRERLRNGRYRRAGLDDVDEACEECMQLGCAIAQWKLPRRGKNLVQIRPSRRFGHLRASVHHAMSSRRLDVLRPRRSCSSAL